MASELAKWLPIWERCPELEPDVFYKLLHDGQDWCLVDCRVGKAVAAALIRDRAMQYLAAHDHEPRLDTGASALGPDGSRSIDGVILWCVYIRIDGEEELVEFCDPNPTKALRLAVCRVLEIEA